WQLEQILKRAEAKEEKRAIKFLEQVKSIELPPESDRAWISKQFKVYSEAIRLAEGEGRLARLFPITVFTMGRAYERYYAREKGYNGGG
ncbi:unnamed protein product, partial [marine sediment metagenome]